MNATVSSALERELAALQAVATPPSADSELGFGRDLSCVDDLEDDFRELSGETAEVLAQALHRRFQTPRGALLDDEDYGLDLSGCLHSPLTQNDLRTLQSKCVGEAMKDERVERATLRVEYIFETSTLNVAGIITPRNPRLKPFAFVLAATSSSVLLETFKEGV